VTNTKLINKGH